MPSLDQRRRRHDALSARLAALSDDQLAALVPETGAWRGNVHGNQSGVVDIDGDKVFVKKLALTDLERANEGSTANLFDLPLFYHYGVGSAGFGAWRELQATLRAGAWALSGEYPGFPLVYHWRVLPRTAPELSAEQLAWLDQAPGYWDDSPAVRGRLEAISAAQSCVALFVEYVPHMLLGWLTGKVVDPTLEATIARLHDQWQDAAAFMNARGLQHFDLNASNLLTDGEELYVADFGLAICEDFDLSPDERAFCEGHRLYDHSYVAWAFGEWLAPREDPPVTLTPALSALVERGRPVAKVFRRFLGALATGSKTAPFPRAELEAALTAPPAPP